MKKIVCLLPLLMLAGGGESPTTRVVGDNIREEAPLLPAGQEIGRGVAAEVAIRAISAGVGAATAVAVTSNPHASPWVGLAVFAADYRVRRGLIRD